MESKLQSLDEIRKIIAEAANVWDCDENTTNVFHDSSDDVTRCEKLVR